MAALRILGPHQCSSLLLEYYVRQLDFHMMSFSLIFIVSLVIQGLIFLMLISEVRTFP